MKKSTIIARLEKLAQEKQVNKTSCAYTYIKEWLEIGNQNGMIRTCHTSGRGRFCSNLDYTRAVENLCDALKLKIESGNDAPRGGLTGNFVKIITKVDFNN